MAPVQAPSTRPVLTSLPLQIFVYFGMWWDVAYWLLSVAVFVYKGFMLPYPTSNYAVEFVFVFLYLLVEPARLFLGTKGNKTEQPGPLLFSLLLAGPVIAFYVFYMQFQTYVLKIDIIINAISIAFCGLQVLMGLIAAIRFISIGRYG